jgi:hypothetical protein
MIQLSPEWTKKGNILRKYIFGKQNNPGGFFWGRTIAGA